VTTIELAWGPVQREMADVLAVEPPDIATVLHQLTQLQDILERIPPDFGENPVADFNRLYRTITASIECRLRAGDFADPVFLELLDVEFAKRYLVALRLWSDPDAETPWAWSVLFRRLRDRTLRALPSAAAGVNAHINYDLPFALVATWEKLGSRPCDGPQHDDYLLINRVFFDAIPGLRRGYLENWQLVIDRLNGKVDDWYQNLLVEVTRDLAWRSAERIWAVRHQPLAVEHIRHSLDRNAALLGCALLSPFCSFLQ
jgi:hypothetical protein